MGVSVMISNSHFLRTPSPARSAVEAAVAENLERALLTFLREMRHVKILLRDQASGLVFEFKTQRSTLIRHTRSNGLQVLRLLAADPVTLPVFDKDGASLHEAEGDIPRNAFLPQCLDPVKTTWSAATVILTSAGNLLDLSAVQIPADNERTQKRCTVQPLVSERKIQQQGDPFVSTVLVFTGHIQEDIPPTIALAFRQAISDSFGTFGQQQEYYIASFAHDLPRFGTPWICLRKKEIRSHADADHFTTLDLVSAGFIF